MCNNISDLLVLDARATPWLPWWFSSKESACSAGDTGDRLDSWVRKIPWKMAWQPTPVFLPGEYHGQRSLAGYSQWGLKESDTAEVT